MHGKERGYERTAPQGSSEPQQNKKQQNAVCGVQQQACQVMHSRVEPVQLNVEHVRHPGERVPVNHVPRRKRPRNAIWSESARDEWILRDVLTIVKGDQSV